MHRIVSLSAAMACVLSAALFCFGAESSLKARIPLEEQRKQAVIQVDGSNLRIEEKLPLPTDKKKKTDPSSLAARLGEPEKDIHWTPAWNPKGSGSLRLRSVVSSPDKSVIVCLEETGTIGKGPYGGRLLIVDTVGRRILRVFEIGRKITRIALDPAAMSAVCFAEKQEELSQKSGFAVVDLRSGAEMVFVPAETPVSFLVRSGKIYSASANGVVTVFRPGAEEKKTFTAGPSPRLDLSGDGKLLIAASDDAVRFYNPDSLKEIRSVKLPAGTRLYRIVQGSRDASRLFYSTGTGYGKSKVFLVMEQGVKEVSDDSSGEIACNPKDNAFFCGRLLRNRLYRLDPNTFEELSYCDPKNLRPVTSGKTLELFCGPLPGEVIVLDSRGALYSLQSIRKRWRKSMIVESGMR